MSEKSEQEQIIEEAKKRNPGVPNPLVSELDVFLGSDLNKTELNAASLKRLTEDLLKKLTESSKS